MRKVILLFMFVVVAMISVNAQDSAKQDSLKQDSVLMVEALNASAVFEVQRVAYMKYDSLLIQRYSSSKGTFIHRQKVKLKQPYQYEQDGKIIVEDMYRQRDEEKPAPTSKADFNNWIKIQKTKYLQKE